MRFITYWMHRFMADPDELAEKWQKHCTTVQDGADEVRARWIKDGIQSNGYWTFKDRTGNTRKRLAESEVHPLSAYAQAVKAMDDKEQRTNDK